MAEFSAIEWTDSTWNPVTGCTKISPGCKFCYAERVTARWGRGKFTDVKLHLDRLGLPLKWRTRRRIFVNSMSDLFHEQVPFSFIDEVFDIMGRAPQHIFQVLTKRADRMVAWSLSHGNKPIPGHIWLGVSVETPAYFSRIDRLREIEVPIRFVSAEPLLSSLSGINLSGISWVITGGESGGPPERALVAQTSRGWVPKPEALIWVRELRNLCQSKGVAFFHKQWGGPTPRTGGRRLDRRLWDEFPTAPKIQPALI
ncbi:MAG: phage Gp37/Gp68 family protein [Deltaproteobacteria bacterium]|nr:phage Gp37/Gp68 family protein [Deltaproteobacteria bacterium]